MLARGEAGLKTNLEEDWIFLLFITLKADHSDFFLTSVKPGSNGSRLRTGATQTLGKASRE